MTFKEAEKKIAKLIKDSSKLYITLLIKANCLLWCACTMNRNEIGAFISSALKHLPSQDFFWCICTKQLYSVIGPHNSSNHHKFVWVFFKWLLVIKHSQYKVFSKQRITYKTRRYFNSRIRFIKSLSNWLLFFMHNSGWKQIKDKSNMLRFCKVDQSGWRFGNFKCKRKKRENFGLATSHLQTRKNYCWKSSL